MRFPGLQQRWTSHNVLIIALIGLGISAIILAALAVPKAGLGVFAFILLPLAGFIVFLRPEVGIFLLAFSLPVENALVFGEEITTARLLGLYVAAAWLVGKMTRRESWEHLKYNPLTKLSLPLFALVALSATWAVAPSDAYIGLFRLIRLLAFSLMVMDLIRSWQRAEWLAKFLVLGGLSGATLTLQQAFIEGARRAGEGIAGNENGTAAVLVTILPFAFYLYRSQRNAAWRWLGGLYLVLAVIAVITTYSRTSYLLLVVFFLAHYWEEIKRRSRLVSLIMLTAVLVGGIILLPQERIRERTQTILPYIKNTFSGNSGTVSVRGFIWRVGLAMAWDHPFLGVGYENFDDNFRLYRFKVPDIPERSSSKSSSHNSYIGFLAELGLIGLGLWLGLLYALLRLLRQSWLKLVNDRTSAQFLMARAVIFGFLMQVAYGLSINIQEEKMFWLLAGIGLAIGRLVSQVHSTNEP
ncbi:MAG: O-antigen ligase family protein [Anaerolineales bacterium]|nr:O-antigen ligase family protein [Anaerolineales bacterium]